MAASSDREHCAQPNPHRTLRVICLISWVPGFALLLAHGIVAESALPAICLIPLTISSATAAVYLSGVKPRAAAELRLNVTLVALFFAFLVPSWVSLGSHRYRWGSDDRVLAAYATMPVMINFLIHFWIVLEPIFAPFCQLMIRLAQQAMDESKRTCPHCDGDLRTKNTSRNTRYAALSSDYDDDVESGCRARTRSKESMTEMPKSRSEDVLVVEPRPETYDETARLV